MMKQAEEGIMKASSKGNLNLSIAGSNVASQGPDSGQQLGHYTGIGG
jgi:hypothetical protein